MWSNRFLLTIVFAGLVLVSFSCVKKVPDKIVWNSSLTEGFRLAQEKNKNLLVDFFTEDCKWCKRLDDSTFTDRDVIRLGLEFYFVKVNAIKDSSVANQYGVNAYPSVLLFNSKGEEIDRIVGYLPPREFLITVRSYFKGEGTLTDYENKLSKDTKNVELLYRVAEKYQDRGNYNKALFFYQTITLLDPKNTKGKTDSTIFSMGLASMKLKNYPTAVQRFSDLSKSFPKSGLLLDAEEYIPYAYAKSGDTTKALSLFQKLLEDHPDLSAGDKEWVETQIKNLRKEE